MARGLTARKVLQNTAGRLAGNLEGELITFDPVAFTEIADDSDYHRTRIAYMDYQNGKIVRVSGKSYFIGSGVHEGNYPGGQYRGDLMILPLPSKNISEEKIRDAIRESEYFAHSPLIAMEGGFIAMGYPIEEREKIIKKLKNAEKFVQRGPEYHKELVSLSDLSPIVTRSMTYQKRFPRFLAQVLREVYFK